MIAKLPLSALAGWTVFVWTNRIRNIVDAEGWVTHWRMAVSVSFVAAAVLLAGLVCWSALRDRRGRGAPAGVDRTGLDRAAGRLGVGLAVVGGAWWIVRDLGILLGDHSVGFKVVHTLLAVVTVLLSGWVVRSVARSTRQVYAAPGESR